MARSRPSQQIDGEEDPIVILYSSVGLLLLVGGVYYAFHHSNDGVAITGGVVAALLGIAFIVRISANIIQVTRATKT